MTEKERKDFQKAAGIAIREASRNGSKLEKFYHIPSLFVLARTVLEDIIF
jgi:hypothetical protein